MNSSIIKSSVLSSLLERNYNVYISLLNGDFVIERDGCYGSCLILKTTLSSKGGILLDLRGSERKTLKHDRYTYVIAVQIPSLEMWLIPVNDIANNRTLSLSKSKEHYIVRDKSFEIPPTLVSSVAKAEKDLEIKKNVIYITHVKKTEDEHKKEVKDILKR